MPDVVPQNALVVVADGHKAILLRNTASDGGVSLREERRMSPKDLADEGPSGSRPEDQSPKQTDEATFAKQLAHTLFTMHERGAYKDLVLFADPQTLGQTRDVLHKTVAGSLVASHAKDLTNHSVHEIETALRK